MSRGPSGGKTHQRGAMVAERPASASGHRRGDDAIRPKSHWRGARLRSEDETKHFKLIGTTGTGKSTAIQEMLNGALARGDRAVIADPDGGYMRQFHR